MSTFISPRLFLSLLFSSDTFLPGSHHRPFLAVRFSHAKVQRSDSPQIPLCANSKWIERQPSTNRRFGYSVKFLRYLFVSLVLSPLLEPAWKINPAKEAGRLRIGGKEKCFTIKNKAKWKKKSDKTAKQCCQARTGFRYPCFSITCAARTFQEKSTGTISDT